MGNRVALVTGGSRGIGRAVVRRLAADGFDVAFCYRADADAARAVETEVAATGGCALAVRTDVADLAGVRALVAATEDRFGGIDLLVTSAGIVRDNPFMMMSEQDWHQVVDANLGGTFNACRSVIFEMMKRRSGVIVNIASIAGVYGNPTQANYSASKSGTIGLSKALAKEVGRYGIRVNVVAPGFIDTDMTAALPEKVRAEALRRIPLRRLGAADEVADLVAFLASDRARYITGAVLQIDGGLVL